MKKYIAILAVVVLCACLLAGCGNKNKNTDDKFIVGFDASFPPYGYKDDAGNYVGFDLDLAQEVCSRNGWEYVAQPIDWDSKDMELESETIDCIWNGFTMSDERLDKYTWSSAYVDNSQVFVVATDSGIETLADLAGKNVVVQAASSALDALESEDNAELSSSFASLTQVPDYNTAFMNLESGAADAIAIDIGVAKYQTESRGDAFKILDEELAKEQYAVGFLLGNTKLRDKVEATLRDMAADGTLKEISDKWDLTDSVIFENFEK